MRLPSVFSSSVYKSLACAVLLGLTACTPANDEAATDTKATPETIRIATEGAYPPFNYTTKEGVLAGFDIDVANAICAQLEQKCEIIAQDWDGIVPGLLAGKYDAIIAGMSVTPARLQKVDFTDPYFTNTMVWLSKKEGDFNTSDITNKSLGGQRSTTLGAYLQDNFDGKNGNAVNLYDTYDNAYLDLKVGRVDAVLAEKVSAADWLSDNPEYAIIGEELDNDDNVAIAMRPNDALKAKFNTAIAALKANGEMAKLEQANFGVMTSNNAPSGEDATQSGSVTSTEALAGNVNADSVSAASPTNIVVDNDALAVDHVIVVEGQEAPLDGAEIVKAEEAVQ